VPKIRILPDNIVVDSDGDETLLESSLRAGIHHAHACGGRAYCSTCRVEISAGLDTCAPRNVAEQAMADRLGFCPTLRLACQLTSHEDITARRLVLDEQDLELTDQRARAPSRWSAGEQRTLAILFADIRGFTAYSEALPAYDVMHVLNRFFRAMGAPIARYGGHIDNYMGDGLMALFGLRGDPQDCAHRAVEAGLEMLEAMQAMRPYLETAYGRSFQVGIGIHHGEAVVGTLGAIGSERVTAIGDAVNLASRIESANKPAGTHFLISDAVRVRLPPGIRLGRSVSTALPGKSGLYQLHEVIGTASLAADSASLAIG
jgi:adenylate cyclase